MWDEAFLFCFPGWDLIEHDDMFIRMLVYRRRGWLSVGTEKLTKGRCWEDRSRWDQSQRPFPLEQEGRQRNWEKKQGGVVFVCFLVLGLGLVFGVFAHDG